MNPLLLPLAGVLALALAWPAAAQPAPPQPGASVAVDAQSLAKLRERVRADRRGLVAQNLKLSEAEGKAFWPVYERCHTAIEAAHRRVNRAIVEFVEAESRMTDAHAKQIAAEVLDAEAETVRARKTCFDRVAKVLPGRKAARYLQIETKLASLARFDAAVAIPLVD